MQNKFGHVETISYLCSIKKNKEKQQFKTAVDRINTDTETMKLQNIISIIKVKDSKIALDPLSVAYPVINSSFLRRHIFRLMEITPGLSRIFVGTYGFPIRDTKNYLPGQLKNALTFEYYNRADIEKTFAGVK